MLGNRYSQHSFAQVPDVHISRSRFDRSFTVKDTFNFDYLVPIMCDEVLPGDTINLNLNVFARLATQLVPIMDNLYIDYFFFFVPNRLVWTNWEKFMGAQTNPGDSIAYLVPQLQSFSAGGPEVDTIFDKFGLPTDVLNAYGGVNALPFRAYNLIWNTWFRDENLQNSITVPTDDGPDATSTYTLKKRNKRHDYFTSALPWPSKNGSALVIPSSGTIDVLREVNAPSVKWFKNNTQTVATASATPPNFQTGGSDTYLVDAGSSSVSIDPNGSLYVSLNSANASTINDLRTAFQLQALYELDARGGTRYVEILQAHFGVISPDFRLQRPEYLGGGETVINSHPVAQSAPTSGSAYFAQLGAFGTSSSMGKNIGFTKSFVEHGYVIGLACARADITYQQGLNKLWTRLYRYEYFWPKLQEIGEQTILNKEIYLNGDSNDGLVFGYQERYAEYKYKPSEIHGQFRSTYATPIDQWHMAEEFSSLPSLNSAFIAQNTPIARAIANTSSPHILFDGWFKYFHARPMLAHAVPASLGRF